MTETIITDGAVQEALMTIIKRSDAKDTATAMMPLKAIAKAAVSLEKGEQPLPGERLDLDQQREVLAALSNPEGWAFKGRYRVPIGGLLNGHGQPLYLTKSDDLWIAIPRNLHPSYIQAFTAEELKEAPGWAQKLEREMVK